MLVQGLTRKTEIYGFMDTVVPLEELETVLETLEGVALGADEVDIAGSIDVIRELIDNWTAVEIKVNFIRQTSSESARIGVTAPKQMKLERRESTLTTDDFKPKDEDNDKTSDCQ